MSLFTVGKDFLGIFYNFQMFLSKHLASLRLTNIEFSLLYMLYNANGTSQDELSKLTYLDKAQYPAASSLWRRKTMCSGSRIRWISGSKAFI